MLGCTDGDGAGDVGDGETSGVAVGTRADDPGAVGVGRCCVSCGLGVGVHATARATTAPTSESDVRALLDATVAFMRTG